MDNYFLRFEHRKPPKAVPYHMGLELLFQFVATVLLVIGAWYIYWRWTDALNWQALWFAIPLVMAETCAYIGTVLFVCNLWKTKDTPRQAPPQWLRECVADPNPPQRKIKVDVFFPTYDEEPELVELSLRDAKRMRYPHQIDIQIYLLDDGRRQSMRELAQRMGVGYITRDNNVGFKAGNMRHAMSQTSGDFIVICDADTRPLPTLLEHTLGYFRDPNVAWVQTPQWFFDLPSGTRLTRIWRKRWGKIGGRCAKWIERIYGPVVIGRDPFANDPTMFYDVIQRRRNWLNASFCCGAGSIHRREAVMEAALRAYAEQIEKQHSEMEKKVRKMTGERQVDQSVSAHLKTSALLDTELTPYKFHVSEDIYTSMVLHGDPTRNWRSVFHPQIESKMLSPQDLQTWTVQRFKYSGGTIDIALHDNVLKRKGMSFGQKLMYFATAWGNFAALWNIVFLLSPIIYFATSIAPVSAYDSAFYLHFLPFIICSEITMMLGTWGVAGFSGKTNYLAFFPVNLRALWTVLRGEKISFPATPKSRQDGQFYHLVWAQIAIVVLSIGSMGFAWAAYWGGFWGHYAVGGLVLNSFWVANNVIAMKGMIKAASWQPRIPKKPWYPIQYEQEDLENLNKSRAHKEMSHEL
ncbi:hypothetical protein VST7929_02837 [Vibrio stylophorae]|uniref:Glycosyltransferase 2-like domain-containing protein n=1 Tax=Vibrio stylophorae TaxID=659351 RepID=A0ABM8ZX15_9VIBR|nr:cellulose synthase catalytic subunit [Vibrio stylophorae]CAH0535176.1 hypothetical protein VST7929_02837 [Vibrio stylophorae]